jgi:hypothetical protein
MLAASPVRWAIRCALCALAGSMGAPLGGALLAAGTATITGRVSYAGTVPAPVKRKLIEDPACAAMHKDGMDIQRILVKDGSLAEVLVHVKSGITGTHTPPAEPVLIDQKGCEWLPRMVGVMAGQPLKIRNSDHTSHNVHPFPKVNKEFNIMQPRKGMENTKTFDKPELMIPLHCAAHPWMEAYISVFSHPFYSVTAEDGRFEIKGLPDGDYEIEAIHGKLGTVTGKVTVKGAAPASLDLAFPARNAR